MLCLYTGMLKKIIFLIFIVISIDRESISFVDTDAVQKQELHVRSIQERRYKSSSSSICYLLRPLTNQSLRRPSIWSSFPANLNCVGTL